VGVDNNMVGELFWWIQDKLQYHFRVWVGTWMMILAYWDWVWKMILMMKC